MKRARLVQLVALLACVSLLAAAATRIRVINDGRRALRIYGSESPVENTPPEYVFYIQAFGAFRGLIADIAFIRADSLKNQGRYFDAYQLHKWICALQPHFPSVWEYCSWNMAWNISVTTFTPEERWNWVYNGVKLLRDQGIPLNPRAVNLYKQLAWTFNNKMSEPTDDQHYAYKCNWAWRMHLLLGPPPPPLSIVDPNQLSTSESPDELDPLEASGLKTFEQNTEKLRRSAAERGQEFQGRALPETAGQQDLLIDSPRYRLAQAAARERIQVVRDAAPTLAELYARQPDARGMVAALTGLGITLSDDSLTEDAYWRAEGLAFTLLRPYWELKARDPLLARVARPNVDSAELAARMRRLDEILGVTAGNPAGEELIRFVQRKALSEVYRLDPALMTWMVDEFGPIDWRGVDAHGFYWSVRGLIAGGETISQFGNDKTNTARIVFFCLRNLFLKNTITFEPNPDKIHLSYLNLSRDLNFIGPMHAAYVKYGPYFDPQSGQTAGAGDTYRSGHINFLTEAIRLLYLSGRDQEAAAYYEALRTTYPLTVDGRPNPAFRKNLHDFVLDNFRESLAGAGMRELLILIDGWLSNAFSQLAAGDVDAYARLVRAARDYYEEYMRTKRDDPGWERARLPEFIDLQIDAFGMWFATQPGIAPAATLHKVRLWDRAPLYLRQAVYDRLLPSFQAECQQHGFDVDRAFPEPRGMAEFRQQQAARGKQDTRDPDVVPLPQTNE